VVTRGKGLQFTGDLSRPRAMPILQPLPASIPLVDCERGGDLTYHGPGQLVIYPICKLDGSGWGPRRDVEGFLRKVEQLVIDELQARGLSAGIRHQATGVWVGERKIASMGIAVRRWVTYHGMAINLVNDLSPFLWISPCGFQGEVMTRYLDLIPDSHSEKERQKTIPDQGWTELRSNWEHALARRMGIATPPQSIDLSALVPATTT
jgi:lipoate-protein ligase B